jgi:outer membrane immunogenic protein
VEQYSSYASAHFVHLLESFMKLCLLAATALVFAITTNQAQSLETYDWTGVYLGANGGYLSGKSHANWLSASPGSQSEFNSDANSPLFGPSVGGLFQLGQFVLGGDTKYLIGGTSFGRTGCPNPSFTCKTFMESVFTFAAKAGYAMDNILFYATGGYAEGNIKSKYTLGDGTGNAVADESQGGWIVGAGADYAFNDWLVAGIEYNHIDLGQATTDGKNVNTGNVSTTVEQSYTSDVILAKIAFKLNPVK